MIHVRQPDSTVRRGYRDVTVIGLPTRGSGFDPKRTAEGKGKRMDVVEAMRYVREHPEWKGSTVDLALAEIHTLTREVATMEGRLANLNSFADGQRPELERALTVLRDEVARLADDWTEPIRDEIAEGMSDDA